MQQFTAKMGNFTPTPSAPTPCKTSRPIPGKTLSECKGHSRSSGSVPGYSRSSSRSSDNNSRNAKSHSRNGVSRLVQHQNHNSQSISRSDSRNCWEVEPHMKDLHLPMHSRTARFFKNWGGGCFCLLVHTLWCGFRMILNQS